jgi:hypothetical protein
VGDPVESLHAFTALDAGAGEHDVVAPSTVVVLLAAITVDDVVPGLVRVVLERGAVVALQQVERTLAALDPVVTVVTEDRCPRRRRRRRSRLPARRRSR